MPSVLPKRRTEITSRHRDDDEGRHAAQDRDTPTSGASVMIAQGKRLTALIVVLAVTGLLPAPAYAHCDGLDGPVVRAAEEALAKSDVDLVLIWVPRDSEAEIRAAFARTLEVRELGARARDLADAYFFETLVRIHRAAEGASFTGLKPAGRNLGPAIPAADRALESGAVTPLTSLLVEKVREGLLDRYRLAREARSYRTDDVDAGRKYIDAYVSFIHYVEALHEAAIRPVEGHYPEDSAHNTPSPPHDR